MTNAQTAATLQPIEIRCACGHLFGKMPEMGCVEIVHGKSVVQLVGVRGVLVCRCGNPKCTQQTTVVHLTKEYSGAIV